MCCWCTCTGVHDKVSRISCSWWQGALLAMAMVLVQQPTQRTTEFRTRIAKLAADKHEEIMCRCVIKS